MEHRRAAVRERAQQLAHQAATEEMLAKEEERRSQKRRRSQSMKSTVIQKMNWGPD